MLQINFFFLSQCFCSEWTPAVFLKFGLLARPAAGPGKIVDYNVILPVTGSILFSPLVWPNQYND